jgi:lauroyl/myristoyl acyltransferase
MGHAAHRLLFTATRKAETLTPPDLFRRIVYPALWLLRLRSMRKGRRRLPRFISLPRQLWMWEHSARSATDHLLELFPDRLASAKWASRCRFAGWEHLENSRKAGRPVVLVFCHFGPYQLLRSWLRSKGVPAAATVYGESEHRSGLRQLTDEVTPLPEVPIVYYLDQIRPMVEFLRQGNVLLISMDYTARKQIQVPVEQGWCFEMATGAIRLAHSAGADLLPCVIVDTAPWQFEIHIGSPVPDVFLEPGRAAEAGRHALEFMLPFFRQHPGQCTTRLLRCFRSMNVNTGPSVNPDELHRTPNAAAR